jgi:hypothetical protein
MEVDTARVTSARGWSSFANWRSLRVTYLKRSHFRNANRVITDRESVAQEPQPSDRREC